MISFDHFILMPSLLCPGRHVVMPLSVTYFASVFAVRSTKPSPDLPSEHGLQKASVQMLNKTGAGKGDL